MRPGPRCAGPWAERRRADSNRRIEVLQTSALPLGYGAVGGRSSHRMWGFSRRPTRANDLPGTTEGKNEGTRSTPGRDLPIGRTVKGILDPVAHVPTSVATTHGKGYGHCAGV